MGRKQKQKEKIMKLNLLRKTLFLVALCGAIIFAGCKNDSGSSEPSVVETITALSVVPDNVNPDAEPVTEAKFETVVEPMLKSELSTVVGSVTKLFSKSNKTSSGTSYYNNSRAVTEEEFEESVAKMKDSIEMKMSEDGTSGSMKGSWSAPTGEIDFGENPPEGVKARLDSLGFNINASYNMSQTTGKISASANAAARFGASAEIDLSKDDESCIKSGKFSTLATFALVGLNASMNPEGMGEMMALSSSPSAMNPEAILGSVTSIGGKVLAYEGVNSAFYFEVEDPDNGNVYNGIIKYDLTASINYNITEESLAELTGTITGLVTSMKGKGTKPTAADFEAFDDLIDMKADFAVYDLTGEKIFTIFESTSFSGTIAEVMKLTTTTVTD